MTARTFADQLMYRVGFENTEEAEVEDSSKVFDSHVKLLFSDQKVGVVLFILVFLAILNFLIEFDLIVIIFELILFLRFRLSIKQSL